MIIQAYFSVSSTLFSFKVSSELIIAVDVLVVSVEPVKMLGLQCVDDDVDVVVVVVTAVIFIISAVVAKAVVTLVILVPKVEVV